MRGVDVMAAEAEARTIAPSSEALLGLFYIQRYRYLTVKQFAKASGLKESWAKDLLRGFENRKLLGSFGNTGMRGHGKTPKCYFLKPRGYRLLVRESGIPEELIGRFVETHVTAKWSPLMWHRLATIDLLLSVELGVREREHLDLVKTWTEYQRVKRGSTNYPDTSDFVADPEVGSNRIVPDAAFVLENLETGRRGLFFLETDMGTERITSPLARSHELSLHGKLRQYDRYLSGGRFARTYSPWGEFKFFTLLFVTTSAKRIGNIRREMQNLPRELHPYYRFGVFDAVVENFFNESWKARALDDDTDYAIVR